MDKACATKLLEVFDDEAEEVGEIARCLRGERLQYLFDTTSARVSFQTETSRLLF